MIYIHGWAQCERTDNTMNIQSDSNRIVTALRMKRVRYDHFNGIQHDDGIGRDDYPRFYVISTTTSKHYKDLRWNRDTVLYQKSYLSRANKRIRKRIVPRAEQRDPSQERLSFDFFVQIISKRELYRIKVYCIGETTNHFILSLK